MGVALLGATGIGAYHGARGLIRESSGEAWAASEPARPMSRASLGLLPLERQTDAIPLPRKRTRFIGGSDDEQLLGPLRHGVIERVKFNRGGSSISLRIDFEGGARAAFKPDQTNLQTIPRKEVAAYRLSRLLGVEAVAPAIPRSFREKDLIDALDPASRDVVPRFLAQLRGDDGEVAGALMWWIPEIKDAALGRFPIDTVDGMVLWKRSLQAGAEIPAEHATLVPQISTMVGFDFLISNSDRWSGSNAKGSPDGKLLYFMDNTLSFGPNPQGNAKTFAYLARVEKFSRSFVASVRALDEDSLREAVLEETEPYERLLTESEIQGVMFRRDRFLAYVDGLVAEHGAAKVLVFP